MKSIDETEAQARLDEILEEAQRQPFTIRRQAEEIAIVLSVADYERLRSGAMSELLARRDDVAREASAAGLTDERLSELLGED